MNEACSQPIEGEAAARLIEPLTELVIRAGEAILAINRAAMGAWHSPSTREKS